MLKMLMCAAPVFVCFFWFLYFVSDYKSYSKTRYLLSILFLVLSVLFVCQFMFFEKNYLMYKFMDCLYMFCSLLVYPLYYVYILSLTESKLSLKLLYFVIPIVLFPVSAAFLYDLMSPAEEMVYIKYFLYEEPFTEELYKLTTAGNCQVIQSKAYSIYFCLQLVTILILISRTLTKFNKKMANYYSNLDNKVLYTPKYLMWIVLMISIASLIVGLLGKESFVKTSIQLFPSSVYAILLFYVGFISSKTNQEALPYEDEEIDIDDKRQFDVNEQKLILLQEQIVELVKNNELYKNEDLKVSDIAALLGTNRTYISRAINQTMNVTFSDMINKYRIEHAISLMKSDDSIQMTLSEIALQSGFSNESTFYRVFKEAMGVTPRQYFHKF